ncbi:MAG: hypothetical protein HYR73_08245 [Candidatus Eisenbacteria bacterium]|nr:hypothetical protein [Candidatus Eisenbacteria bacterium]
MQLAVRAYMDATNKADATAMAEMMSQNTGTSSISDGSITRGWEAIRNKNDADLERLSKLVTR